MRSNRDYAFPAFFSSTSRLKWVVVVVWALAVISCGSLPKDQILLMPAPEIYRQANLDPFTDRNPIEDIPYGGILYATDRLPATDFDRHYLDERGYILRLGVAGITAGKQEMTWEEARYVSLLKERPDDYPLKVSQVEEIGALERSINVFTTTLADRQAARRAEQIFTSHVNAKLALSDQKDIFIYVHGYKVVFENPLLVASELWHFLGYQGVFIAYAWPSTPNRWAYVADLETASLSAGNLRLLLEFLSNETDVRRIHIIGYSAGTRVVAEALHQLALMHRFSNVDESMAKPRIGHVILTGSDIDRQLFGAYLVNGLADVARQTTIYVSKTDKALGISKWLFRRERLGQTPTEQPVQETIDYLRNAQHLAFINVTEAEGAASGNGHAYFRQSPWTSSDILATLLFDFKPAERGLVMVDDTPIWKFPDDYIARLRQALYVKHPEGFSR